MPHSDRTARLIQNSGQAFEAGELIKSKLERAIKNLADASEYAKEHGRLSPDEQHAVRVMRSKMRMVDREWLAQYGQGKSREDAKIELSVDKPDDGTLVKFGEKMHSQGRLSCQACAQIPDESAIIPQSAARLCIVCRAGIEHCIDVQEFVPDDSGGTPTSVDGSGTVPEGGQQPGKWVYRRRFWCDSCYHTDSVML